MTAPAIRRVLAVCEALQRSPRPVCAGSLAMSLTVTKRTVLRDLRALNQAGLVTTVGGGKRGATVRWVWNGTGMLRTTA